MVDVIAIDGPSAAGKSTVAERIANALGYQYLDTGLLYRAVTREALIRGVDMDDEAALGRIAESMPVSIRPDGTVDINGISGLSVLRTKAVDRAVSQVSSHESVRNALNRHQRSLAENGRLVLVGRDIATVVVPDADWKIYLDASPEERARRRHLELIEGGRTVSREQVLAEIRARDETDSNRAIAPLKKDESAIVINTDGKSIDDVVLEIVGIATSESANDDRPVASDDPESRRSFSLRRRAMNLWAWPTLRLTFKVTQQSIDNVPLTGPLLYVSNHLHNADPMIEYYAFPRPLHFMGKKELFGVPVVKQIAELSGGFPVDRGKFDREALRHIESRIEQGIAVGIYPEGGRSPTGSLVEGKSGAGLMALRTGAPILPVAITGSERYPVNGSKGKMQAEFEKRDPGHEGVQIAYGKPFRLVRLIGGRKIGPQEATTIIMCEIADLLPPEYRGVYESGLDEDLEQFKVPYSSQLSSSSSSSP